MSSNPKLYGFLYWCKSIRFRLAFSFGAISAIVLLTIQAVQFYGLPLIGIRGNQQELISREFDALNSVADSRKKLVTDWVQARRRNALTIAKIPAITSGRFLQDPLIRKHQEEWLEELRNTYNLDAIRFFDPKSRKIILSAPQDAPAPPLSIEQLQDASRPGADESIFLTANHADKTSRIHFIRQIVSERSTDGTPEMLVEIQCDLELLLRLQLDSHLPGLMGKTGEFFLVDSNRRFLTKSAFKMADGSPVVPLETINPAKAPQLAISGSEGSIESVDYRNVNVLAAYRHLQITPEVVWAMVVKKDRSEVLNLLHHQRNIFLSFAFAAIFATGLLAMLIASKLTRPMRKMVETTRKIEQGELTARASEEGDNETAELAKAFNKMLDQLQAWHTEMDYRVRQRTEQLAILNTELHNEIIERTKTEEALHEKTVQLEDEVAERQKAQEALSNLNTTLEQRIAVAVTELRQKDDMLIQQNRLAAMGELMNNIAHQWRQPLNNIAAYIQAMQYLNDAGELTKEEMNKDIRSVMDILQYMSQTIDDFRSFFVRDRSNTHDFKLLPVITRALNLISPALSSHKINVALHAAEETDFIATGYSNEFAQVLVNILYNARDALVSGKPQNPLIEIRVQMEEENPVVLISDNGGGIPTGALPHIFEPYFTTKGPSEGTGIGLYMSKTIIEKNMGGKLTARNLAHGAEFRIEFKR